MIETPEESGHRKGGKKDNASVKNKYDAAAPPRHTHIPHHCADQGFFFYFSFFVSHLLHPPRRTFLAELMRLQTARRRRKKKKKSVGKHLFASPPTDLHRLPFRLASEDDTGEMLNY